jgi:hypothetical protein
MFFCPQKLEFGVHDFDGVVFLELFLKNHLDVPLEVEIVTTTCTIYFSLCHLECYENSCTKIMRKLH